jgi:2-polyprenyl-3-methyl-5-hydroxy-6-metoxy-1,4-benzoquinol methylase
MLIQHFAHLRCPVFRSNLRLEILEFKNKTFEKGEKEVVWTGILFAETGPFFYPIINGVPRVLVESFLDYQDFFQKHLPDFQNRKLEIEDGFKGLVKHVVSKNYKTKKSFSQEWNLYQYGTDKTWDLEHSKLVSRFCKETNINEKDLSGKWIFDAGCGNGFLNIELGKVGAFVASMDFSHSIEKASSLNDQENVFFIQGDVEFPPLPFHFFDIVHCSGVLIHTKNTELSLSDIDLCVKSDGILSTWIYQPSSDKIHNLFNFIRKYSSKLPIGLQYYLYATTLLPVSFLVKKLKGNPQNWREMMIEILDWFSPQFRWEHEVSETETWFRKRNYHSIQVTDQNRWGYNLVGIKGKSL